jgi:hypothetical protein
MNVLAQELVVHNYKLSRAIPNFHNREKCNEVCSIRTISNSVERSHFHNFLLQMNGLEQSPNYKLSRAVPTSTTRI